MPINLCANKPETEIEISAFDQTKDMNTIKVILQAEWDKMFIGFKPMDENIINNFFFKKELAYNEPVTIKVARINDKTAGFIAYGNVNEKGYIHLLGIKKEFQHQGLGQALLVTAEKDLHQIGVQKLVIEVLSNNLPAINLYKKFGFSDGIYFDKFNTVEMNKNITSSPFEDYWAKVAFDLALCAV